LFNFFFSLYFFAQHQNNFYKFEFNCLSKTRIWVHIYRLEGTFFWKIYILWKSYPSSSSPFLFIKYSKTTYQKHAIHVNIQIMKKMGHIFNKKKIWGLNRGTLILFFMKNTLKCNKNNNLFSQFSTFCYLWNINT
jgi:hypothetical protein